MTAIDFHPEKRTIEELFVGADYYVIPRFQRPYSWEPVNLDDFWRDVVFDNGIGYFIGPMVAWRDANSPVRRVVDGQQRLTTISLMFAVLRDTFLALGEEDLAAALDRYLQKTDRNNERNFTLSTEVEARFLSQAIFKNPPDRTVRPQTEEEHAVARALGQITRLINTEVSNYSEPVERLKAIRDRLLGLRVIWVEHSNEDDAYIIFETLNSRGKDLDVADLLKNHLLNKLRGSGPPAADTARSKWNDMRFTIEADGSPKSRLDVNRFILHWWRSREDYIAERKLFRAMKRKISTKPLARASLDDLVSDAELYRKVMDPRGYPWPIEEVEARRALAALVDFGIAQPAPLLLSLVRARVASPKLGAAQFRRTLQTIERFHFQYTVISQLSSSGGVSEMYAKAAKDLTNAGVDQNKQARVLQEIRQKLVDRAPDRGTFVNAFGNRFFFTSSYTRDTKAVRYVLSSILRAQSPDTTQDNLTIEHILPQAGNKPLDVVGSIGNLLLVSAEVNKQLGSASFEQKERILAGSAKAYDIGGVVGLTKWTKAEIEARATLLAEFAYDTVWKLPV